MEGNGAYFTSLLNNGSYAADFEDLGTEPSEAQHSPPVKETSPSSKPNQKQKGKNFVEEEDRLLVSAWLNISTDPAQGTNQSRASFWTRVHIFYQTNKRSFAERSQNSLLHRWTSIQEAVSKFCGCISQIDGRNQSGVTIHDRVEEAEKLFKAQDPNKKSFQFRHCWLQLRNQPKWFDKMQQSTATKTSNKKQKITKYSSPGIVDLTTQDGTQLPPETVTPGTGAPQRPIGKKKAKEVLRRGGTDACIEALDILWAKKKEADIEKELKREERYAKTYALDKERLELEKKRLANEDQMQISEQMRLANEANSLHIKRLAEEERIMNKDLSSLNEIQKQYYMSLQAEIMAARMQ